MFKLFRDPKDLKYVLLDLIEKDIRLNTKDWSYTGGEYYGRVFNNKLGITLEIDGDSVRMPGNHPISKREYCKLVKLLIAEDDKKRNKRDNALSAILINSLLDRVGK